MAFYQNKKIKLIIIFTISVIVFVILLFVLPKVLKEREEVEYENKQPIKERIVVGVDKDGLIIPDEKCESFSGREKEECLNKWTMSKAIGQTKNLKECLLIKDISQRNYCLFRIARLRKGIDFCLKITDHGLKERCISGLGIFQRSEDVCNFFNKEPHEKKECSDRIKAFIYGDDGEANKCLEITTLEYSGLCIENSLKTSGQKCADLKTEELRNLCGALLMYPLANTEEECNNLPIEDYRKVCLIQVKSSNKKYYEIDSDKDQINDKLELWILTDPFNSDTDADGLTDGEEYLKYHTNSVSSDTDGDGLSDYDEIKKYNTHPNKPDTDGDGVSDGNEIKAGTDTHTGDSDKDGLLDVDEEKFGTDINNSDTDGDGMSDFEETRSGYDPLKPGQELADTDGDRLLDINEIFYGTDRFNPDTDGDGISDKIEVDNLTNPLGEGDMDFDGDGLSDKEEEKLGTNPSMADEDWDNLNDYEEIRKYKTNPKLKDTDGDGYSDGEEVRKGYNPLSKD